MDPRAGLDDVKRKFLTVPGLELGPVGRSALASHYTGCAIVVRESQATFHRTLKMESIYFSETSVDLQRTLFITTTVTI
jgi:hypothetical protein